MKKLLLSTITALCLVIFAGGAVGAYDPLCSQYNSGGKCVQGPCATTPDSPICKQNAQQQSASTNENPISGPHGVLQTATNLVALLSGIVAVIMIIVSGAQFITAGGSIAGQRAGDNPSRAKKARATLGAAVTGLVVVALAWSILSFIIQKFVE